MGAPGNPVCTTSLRDAASIRAAISATMSQRLSIRDGTTSTSIGSPTMAQASLRCDRM
jgi:hypothetical protein